MEKKIHKKDRCYLLSNGSNGFFFFIFFCYLWSFRRFYFVLANSHSSVWNNSILFVSPTLISSSRLTGPIVKLVEYHLKMRTPMWSTLSWIRHVKIKGWKVIRSFNRLFSFFFVVVVSLLFFKISKLKITFLKKTFIRDWSMRSMFW